MTDKKFSIVLPTRERPELLHNLLQSIQYTTEHLDEIEVLLAVDKCDQISLDFVQEYAYDFPFMSYEICERSLQFSRDYYNRLTKLSTGKWVIACNDDAVFKTENWDSIAEETLNAYIGNKPNIVYGFIEDGLGEFQARGCGDYCCFPLQGRDGINLLGYFFPERTPTWGADIWARQLYDQVGRVCHLPIEIFHHCYHNNSRPVDHINERIQTNQIPIIDFTPSYQEINVLLGALRTSCVR